MKASKFIVKVSQDSLFKSDLLMEVDVLAEKPDHALNLIKREVVKRIHSEEFPLAPTTIRTTGKRGGKYERFLGWDSLTFELMMVEIKKPKQLELAL